MRKLSRNHKFLIVFASCLIFWAILIMIIVCAAGCENGEKKEPLTKAEVKGEAMLVRIGRGSYNGTNIYTIVYDIDTGVEYVEYQARLYPLYNPDGTLKTYTEGE